MSSKLSFASVDNILQNEEVEEYSETVIKDVSEFFEIDECVDFISSLSGTIENICLQFPDSLLKHAPFVASTLQNRTLKKCFTLADTSYGSCCVDEVAAKHVNAHAIVHFGHSCLSKTENLPVFYVFGKSDFNLQKFLEKLKLTFKPDEKLLIFYDVTFNYVSSEIKKQLSIVFKNVVFSNLITHSEFTASDKVKKTFGRIYKLNDSLTDYKIVYIGEEGSTLNNFIVHFNRNEFYSFSVVRNKLRREGLTVNKFLMKRFYLIEKAKDANIIGIVVSTLGVAKYKQLLDRIKTIIKNAQKTYYVILVGKINIPKLANFMEIDIFVNVACAESSNIDSKDFYKPIITPYELEIACLSNRQWTSDYVTDFSELLPGASHHVGIEKDLSDNSEPEYSLITGRLRSSNLYDNDKSANTTDIVTRDPVGDLVEYKPQNALEYLSSRSWKGLDKNAPAEVKKAEKGRQATDISESHLDHELKLIHQQIARSEQSFSSLIKDLTNLTVDFNRVESRNKELSRTLASMTTDESLCIKNSLSLVSQHILNVSNNLNVLIKSLQMQVVQPISSSMDELKVTRETLHKCSTAKAKQNLMKKTNSNKSKSKKQNKRDIELQEEMLELTKKMNSLEEDVVRFEKSKLNKLKLWLSHYTHSCLSYHVKAVEEFTKAYQAINLMDSKEHLENFHENLFPSQQNQRIKFVRWNSFSSINN